MGNREGSAGRIAGISLVVGVIVAASTAPAFAADHTVTTVPGLQTALADCASGPNAITMGAAITDALATLLVSCDTTLDLSTYDLTVRNVQLSAGVTLTVEGPTDGSGGTLTADATGYDYEAAIRTTAATLVVTGGSVLAKGGINASAIGARLAESAGALIVDGGNVSAIGYPNAYGTAIGGGYVSGNGGIVTVSAGSLYAEAASTYGVAIGGGGAGASGIGGSGGAVTVTGGTLTVLAPGSQSTGIGGGVSGLDPTDRGGDGGSLSIGAAGVVIVESPRSAFGGGWSNSGVANYGNFGSLQIDGILRLPSGGLYVGPDQVAVNEVSIAATGAILGGSAAPTAGADITGPGQIANLGVIALNPPSGMVLGNNRLLTFNSGAPDIRVFAPSADAGYRTLAVPPTGTAWNTAADGSGAWFSGSSSTTGSGTTALYSVVPAAITPSSDPADLRAVSGEPFAFPVSVVDPSGDALDPQPALTFSSSDCTLPADGVFAAVGQCNITATTSVLGVALSQSFVITIVAGAPAALTLTAPETAVAQGGTVTFAVTGTDVAGNPVDTRGVVVTSSVSTDIVQGLSVKFPTASPHVITATLGAASTSVTIEVIPTRSTSGPTSSRLSNTGSDGGDAAVLTGIGLTLLAAGVALLAARRRRAF